MAALFILFFVLLGLAAMLSILDHRDMPGPQPGCTHVAALAALGLKP